VKILYLGTDPILPACPAGWTTDVVRRGGTLEAPPASCSVCACGADTSTCSLPTVTLYALQTGGPNCAQGPAGKKLLSGVCTSTWVTPMPGDDVSAGFVTQVPGGCPASGGTATLVTAHWSSGAHLCAGSTPAGTCGNRNAICVPPPTAPFTATHCVYHDGDLACPAEYPSKTMLWGEAIADSRGCTQCSCSSPTAGGCGGTTVAYEAAGCGGTNVVAPNANMCTHAPFVIKSVEFTASATPGSCKALGGLPSGTATGTDPLTVCCLN